MGALRTPRERWIEEGLRALRDGGPGAVRIEALAHALGVTKGGFYGYFANRDALLAAMLRTWEDEVTADLIARVEAGGGDARTRLRRLYAIVSAGDGLITDLTTDLAIRDWARRDAGVAEHLRRVDERRMAYLRTLIGAFCPDPLEVEARCLIAYSLWIGDRLVAAGHGRYDRADVLERIRARLLA